MRCIITRGSVRETSGFKPIVLIVHAEGANVGTADARVVTSSANLYYNDQQLCWTKIYFGTIRAGGYSGKIADYFPITSVNCSRLHEE